MIASVMVKSNHKYIRAKSWVSLSLQNRGVEVIPVYQCGVDSGFGFYRSTQPTGNKLRDCRLGAVA